MKIKYRTPVLTGATNRYTRIYRVSPKMYTLRAESSILKMICISINMLYNSSVCVYIWGDTLHLYCSWWNEKILKPFPPAGPVHFDHTFPVKVPRRGGLGRVLGTHRCSAGQRGPAGFLLCSVSLVTFSSGSFQALVMPSTRYLGWMPILFQIHKYILTVWHCLGQYLNGTANGTSMTAHNNPMMQSACHAHFTDEEER